MNHKTMHRGLAVLALSLSLALAGAQPAAAAGPGFWQQALTRITGFWAGNPTSGLWETLGAWLSGPAQQKNQDLPPSDDLNEQGFGADPNGNSLTIAGSTPVLSSGG